MSSRRLTAVVVLAAAATVAACGGDDGPSGPSASNERVVDELAQLSARIGPSSPASAYLGLASAGLAFGVQPSTVDLTVSGARAARTPGLALSAVGSVPSTSVASASLASAFQAVGFRLVARNVPGAVSDVTINGGVMWDAALSEVVVVLGTGAASSFTSDAWDDDFAIGAIHRVSPEASWMATAGSMNVSAPTSGGRACPGAGLPGYACTLGSFTLAYDIAASLALPYAGNTAAGSRTASLRSGKVNGFVITVDYDRLANGQRALVDAALQPAR